MVVLGFFTLTLIIYAIDHGLHGPPLSDLKPTTAVFFALVPLLLFNYVGFELQNGAAEEMDDPQRDVPIAVLRSGIIGVLLYAVPVFGIITVLPPQAITGIGGFMRRRRHRVQRVRRRAELPARADDRCASSAPCSPPERCG